MNLSPQKIKELDSYLEKTELLKVVFDEVKTEFKGAYDITWGMETSKFFGSIQQGVWVKWGRCRMVITTMGSSYIIGEDSPNSTKPSCFYRYYGDDEEFKETCVEKIIWDEGRKAFVEKLDKCVQRARLPLSVRYITSL